MEGSAKLEELPSGYVDGSESKWRGKSISEAVYETMGQFSAKRKVLTKTVALRVPLKCIVESGIKDG